MTIPILNVAAIRDAEAEADRNGLTYDDMMQRAGRSVAERIAQVLTERGVPPADWSATLLIGPGNNGGDGLVAGLLLAREFGVRVRFVLLKPRPENDPLIRDVLANGLAVNMAGETDMDSADLITTHVLVDALFGIGARLPLSDEARALLLAVHQSISNARTSPATFSVTDEPPRKSSGPHVIAVDCPSGLDCDTGEMDSAVLPADETVTMIAAKPGLLLFPGAQAVGRLAVADLGVPDIVAARETDEVTLFTAADGSALLPLRPLNSHKGTFGRVLIVGGSANYPGAPALAAQAAARGGAGLVTVGVAEPLVEWLSGGLPECTWLHLPHELGALTADAVPILRAEFAAMKALVLGMGMGRAPETAVFLSSLLDKGNLPTPRGFGFAPSGSSSPAMDAQPIPPLVLDADGLSLLSAFPDWPSRLPPDTILTPHPGEMARLTGLKTNEINADRWTLAHEKAAEWNVVLVLKGAHTVVASPDGQLRVLPFKTSALATAGTGDVLAGLIGALRAQGLNAFDAASVGALVHGLAGQRAAQLAGTTCGILARDVIAALPGVFAALER